mmetsp:Transcript_27845/g.88510  ORF Transcript_27845/g.88510 Transcript_27845/m.88510 type:complete len:81 (-) Transcript_27845:3055-3297(-)
MMESFRYSRADGLAVLDQLRIPAETTFLPIDGSGAAHTVIRDMNVRGAPLIAIVAALGLCVDAAAALKDGRFGSATEVSS